MARARTSLRGTDQRLNSRSGQSVPALAVDPFGFFLARAGLRPRARIMRVGFPWISLDSLVRIVTFQWVTRIFRRQKFSRGLPPGAGARNRRPRPWAYGRAEFAHEAKFNLASDFLQEICDPRRFGNRFGRAKRGQSSARGEVSVRSAKARPSARSAAQRSRRHGRGASMPPARLERRNARPARPVMSNAQDPGSGTPEMAAALW